MKELIRKLVLSIEAKDRLLVIAVIFLIIAAGAIYSFHLGDNLRYQDEIEYRILAQNLLSKHSYTLDGVHPTLFHPPGYPLFLSPFVKFGAGIPTLRFLNFIALAASVFLIYSIAKAISSKIAGVIGAILIMCYPVLFYTAGTLYPQTIGAFCLLLILYILLKAQDSIRPFILIGLLSGFLLLMIPGMAICLTILTLWIIYSKRRNSIKVLATMYIAACLVVAPWTTRNYIVYHSFVPFSANFGMTLLYGNSENTTPNTGANTDISSYLQYTKGLNDVEKDKYLKSKAFEFILKHKKRTIKMYFLKLLNHFNYRNNLATAKETSKAKDMLMLITWGPLILLFLLRIFCLSVFKPARFETLLLILYFAYALFYAIFVTRVRYRLPLDFLLLVIVAIFLSNVINGFARDSK